MKIKRDSDDVTRSNFALSELMFESYWNKTCRVVNVTEYQIPPVSLFEARALTVVVVTLKPVPKRHTWRCFTTSG